MEYLVVNVSSPKSSDGTVIWIRGKNGGTMGPNLIDVMNNDERLTDGSITMDENWDFFVDRV